MKKILLAALVLSMAVAAQAWGVEFSADINMTMVGRTATGKLYYRDANTMRRELTNMTIITKRPKAYELFPKTKRYVTVDMNTLKQQRPMADVKSFLDWAQKNNLKKVGTETLQGYACDIYQGSVAFAKNRPPVVMKLWYSPKLEYPLRTESQLSAPMSGQIVSALENIKIGKQSADLFEIPAGYTEAKNVREAMGMSMGMGNFKMPPENDSSKMPSREEMQKAAQSAKEMMNRMKNR